MTYVLDTNAVSAWMRGDVAFLARLARERKGDVSIPQPTLAEIAYGIARLSRSKRRDELESRFEAIRSEVARTPWTDEVSEAFGTIQAALERRGKRIEDFDAAIAAHAVASGAVLVTDNVAHMKRVPGLTLESW